MIINCSYHLFDYKNINFQDYRTYRLYCFIGRDWKVSVHLFAPHISSKWKQLLLIWDEGNQGSVCGYNVDVFFILEECNTAIENKTNGDYSEIYIQMKIMKYRLIGMF